MKYRSFLAIALFFTLSAHHASATQADDTTITIDSQADGPTALIGTVNPKRERHDDPSEH